jgi:hypothetical protein
MKAELLYFDGCTAYQTALKHLEEVIQEKKLDAAVKMIKIEGDQQALASRFLGSPSIRINGLDIEPGAGKIKDFSMRCRLYLEDDEMSEWPSKKMIRSAIDSAVK